MNFLQACFKHLLKHVQSFDKCKMLLKKIVSEEMKTSLVYDINGRLLKTPQKGINIIGGKKVLVK